MSRKEDHRAVLITRLEKREIGMTFASKVSDLQYLPRTPQCRTPVVVYRSFCIMYHDDNGKFGRDDKPLYEVRFTPSHLLNGKSLCSKD